MSTRRFLRLLILGNALLVTGVFVPWLILTSSTFGMPPVQDFSPGGVIWSAIFGIPTIVSGPEVVGLCLIYLSAVVIVVGFSAPYIWRSARALRADHAAISLPIPGIAQVGATICGLCGFFGLVLAPGIELGAPYAGVTPFFGLLLALLGALLTVIALLNLAPTEPDYGS